MKRASVIGALAAVLVAAFFLTPATRVNAASTADHVTLVLAPGLTWDDVTATATPTLHRLVGEAAVGAVSARARVREIAEVPSPLEGALTLSSGAWTQPDFTALAAFNDTETTVSDSLDSTTTGAASYQRIFGERMAGARLGYLGLPLAQRTSDLKSPGAMLGTLGQAVRDAGGLTAAIGNSDAGTAQGAPRFMRPAAIVAMDASGRVMVGDVSTDLLAPSLGAPYGVVTDPARFEREFVRLTGFVNGHDGPSLVVLDAGDPYRAERLASQATSEAGARHRVDAMRSLDRVVALAEKRRGEHGAVVIVGLAPTPAVTGVPQGLGPVIVSAKGWSGFLTSDSTHRAGVVNLADVSATALDLLGIERPVQMQGNPVRPVNAPAGAAAREAKLAALSEAAVAIDATKAGVANLYIGLFVGALLLVAIVVARHHRWRFGVTRGWSGALRAFVLLLLAVPVSSWLMFAVVPLPPNGATATAVFGLTVLGVWAISVLVWRLRGGRTPVIALALATAAVILLDQLFSARLSFTGYLSYSPLLAARFYGLGNEGASLLFGSAIVGLGLALDEWPSARWNAFARRWGVVIAGVAVVGAAAAPMFGANVGVAVWGASGFVLAWFLMNGRRIGWQAVAVALVVTALAIGIFSAVDLFGGGEQTHLGRALTSAERGGSSQLTDIVVRKAQTNARVLVRTNWSSALLAALAFLAFLKLWPRRDLEDMLAENPDVRSALLVALVAGTIGFFSEDSGVVIPSLVMVFPTLAVAWLVLARLVPEEVAR